MWTLKSAQTCKLSMFSLYVYLTLINTSSVIYFFFFSKGFFKVWKKMIYCLALYARDSLSYFTVIILIQIP